MNQLIIHITEGYTAKNNVIIFETRNMNEKRFYEIFQRQDHINTLPPYINGTLVTLKKLFAS